MKTITIQIGNTDNKLTQNGWAHYVKIVRLLIENYSNEIHFSGGPSNWEPWQNVAWVIIGGDKELQHLKNELQVVRKEYNQDSVAWTEGKTKFI